MSLPRYARTLETGRNKVIRRFGMKGPVCHVGSLINRDDADQSTADGLRRSFSHLEDFDFCGIDLFPGPNVDIVGDLCDDDFLEAHPGLRGRFGMVWCSALLEHVAQPFKAAANIEALIKPGGHLYFSGPWVWGYHGYPDDYWRISFSGLKVLFPGLDFLAHWYEGTRPGVGISLDDQGRERKLFSWSHVDTEAADLITDRAMSYLLITAIGVRKSAD